MISERRRLANRRNGRNSTGPTSKAGKERSGRNAFKHGLTAIRQSNPCHSEEINRLAAAFCDGCDNPDLIEQAIIIAECELVIRSVRAQEVAAIERLRDPTAVPIHRSNASLSQAKAAFEELQLICKEHDQYPGGFFPTSVDKKAFERSPPPVRLWYPRDPREELDALRLALPQLRKLQRYARRANARRKRAIGVFLAIQSGGIAL